MKHETKFRKQVYEIVKKISRGQTLSYKQIAEKIGHPRAWRAVGNILNKNQNPKIPCHRVIKSDGRIGGYRYGTKRKTSLLKKESVIIRKGRVVV